MDFIKKRRNYFEILSIISLSMCVVILVFTASGSEIHRQVFFGATIIACGFLTGLWMREHKKLKIARLITDNKILHIQPAIISYKRNERVKVERDKGTEVLISYFGILLGSKIIKFNQDHIHLMEVEIGPGFISLTYGTDKRIQNTRLICPVIDKDELERIVKKFKYETGIKPTISY